MTHGVVLILWALLVPGLWAQENRSGTLKVKLEGVMQGQGQVRVALEKNADDFDSGSFETPKYLSRVVEAKGDSVSVTFPAVPYGTYAIKAFQDLDGDGKLKTGFMGAPEEPWGFSNDATTASWRWSPST